MRTSQRTLLKVDQYNTVHCIITMGFSPSEPSDDPQLDTSDVADDTTTPTTTVVKRKRTETKDPNAPKRPATAYIFFNAEMRPKVKDEHPEMSLAERSKLIGKMWANLKPEKKQVWRLFLGSQSWHTIYVLSFQIILY